MIKFKGFPPQIQTRRCTEIFLTAKTPFVRLVTATFSAQAHYTDTSSTLSRFLFLPELLSIASQMERYEVDTVVIGAGVIGLACARSLARAGHDVLILEKNAVFGEETSARNSEVIHAGIYYPAGSLKARFCVEGRRALYTYAEANGVAHRNCGKLIVAADDSELSMLESVAEKAEANGVEGMRLLTRSEALAMEPALDVAGALVSPETGIIDSHALMLAYLGEAEAHGAQLVTGSAVLSHWRKATILRLPLRPLSAD